MRVFFPLWSSLDQDFRVWMFDCVKLSHFLLCSIMFNCWTKSNSIHELSSVEFNIKCSFDFVHLTTLGIFVHDKCHWGGGLLSDYCPVAYFRWPTSPRKGFMMNTRRNLTLKGLNQKMNNHHKTANSRCVYFIWHFWFGFSWYEASSTSVW